MKLEAACSGPDLLNETRRGASIAFTKEAEIHRKGIGCLDHPLNVPWPWRARGGIRSGRWPGSSSKHCGKAGVERLFDLLRADVMHMYVNAAGSNDLPFPGNHFRSGADNYVNVRLNIGISRLADAGNAP